MKLKRIVFAVSAAVPTKKKQDSPHSKTISKKITKKYIMNFTSRQHYHFMWSNHMGRETKKKQLISL